MTTRERVINLRAKGLSYREIATRLDCNLSYVKRCGAPNAYDNNLRDSRDRKREVRGTCEDCGGVTRYSGTKGKRISSLCAGCSAKRTGLALRGTGHVHSEALAFLRQPRTFSELRDHLGVSNGYVSQMLYTRLMRYGLVRRVKRGVYVATEASA